MLLAAAMGAAAATATTAAAATTAVAELAATAAVEFVAVTISAEVAVRMALARNGRYRSARVSTCNAYVVLLACQMPSHAVSEHKFVLSRPQMLFSSLFSLHVPCMSSSCSRLDPLLVTCFHWAGDEFLLDQLHPVVGVLVRA